MKTRTPLLATTASTATSGSAYTPESDDVFDFTDELPELYQPTDSSGKFIFFSFRFYHL